MTARLPVPCRLQPGDSLPGLLSKAVVANRYDGLSSIAAFFGFSEGTTQVSRSDMLRLAKGEVNLEQLAAFTEHPVEVLEKAALRLAPPSLGRWADYVTTQTWRFCPRCLDGGKGHQRAWLVPFVTACTEHQCALVDRCHRCGTSHSISGVLTIYCSQCHHRPLVEKALSEELECSGRLSSLIDCGESPNDYLDRLMTAWFFSTSEALRPHHRFSPQLRPIAEMRELISRIAAAARDAQSLANAIETQRASLTCAWPHFESVANLTAVRATKLGAVLPLGGIADEGASLRTPDDPWLVPIHVAAEAAKVSPFVLRGLVRADLVPAKLFSVIDDSGKQHKFRMVSLSDLHRFIAGLFEHAIPVEDARRLTSIRVLHAPEVIPDILRGRMSAFRGAENTLGDLMVAYKDSERYTRSLSHSDDAVLARNACSLLGTYHAVVADLAAAGWLTLHRESTQQRLVLSKESVEAFDREFIVVGALANQLGLNPTNLADKLVEVGINPEPMGTLVNVYRRSAIAEADLKAVRDVQSYASRAGRKSTVAWDKVESPRVKRLIELVATHHDATTFARRFRVSDGNLSLIMRGRKPFGRLAARRMEARCGLPEGWLG